MTGRLKKPASQISILKKLLINNFCINHNIAIIVVEKSQSNHIILLNLFLKKKVCLIYKNPYFYCINIFYLIELKCMAYLKHLHTLKYYRLFATSESSSWVYAESRRYIRFKILHRWCANGSSKWRLWTGS